MDDISQTQTQCVYFSTFYKKNVQINNEKMILPLVWVSVLVYVIVFLGGCHTKFSQIERLHRTQIHYLTLTQVRNLGGLG